ncbi:si:dkey-190l8.2 isoform X3 [Phyllopteryx taeniolatus]|uniref:si:dkey-190l8.2 isoform X3 n=2 Tax=Phyllopteryx taeniolatus TaxID=161469 RepID=UPI002AD2A1A3|nr:si:dkey-190l8.2 isoform X3 [Phyllopteryx taeniolatus]
MHTDTLAHKHYFTHMHTDTLAHKHSFIVFSSRDEDCKLAEGEGRGHVEVSKETPAVGHNKLGPESSPHGVLKACGTFQKGRASFGMSPLQLSVLWRLSLAFFFNASLFFLDIFTAAVVEANCHNGNGTQHERTLARNQSESEELSGYESDWMTRSGDPDSVCGWTPCLSYGQTIFMVGLLLGSLVGGVLADRYGKRPLLLVCLSVQAACGLVPAVLPQPFVFLAVRCLTGVCCSCINSCSFSLAVEWTAPSARLWPPLFLGFCFSLGTMGGALLAWLSPTWTQLHLSLALPQFICLPLYRSIPESPSWLVLMERMDVLYHYCSRSEADKQCVDLLVGSNRLEKPKVAAAPKEQPPNDFPLRHPIILRRLSIMSYLGAVTALTYFGICMNIGSFGVNVYSAQFFSGLSEAPCLLVPLVRLDRRPMSMLTLFLSGTACFLSLLLSRYQCDAMLVMSLALVGKLCILVTIFILAVYSTELFPTVVRQRCMSAVNLCFRLGCLLSTLFPANTEGAISLAAMLIYSSGPIIGCVLCLLLPETSGTLLPDSMEDCHKPPQHPLERTR